MTIDQRLEKLTDRHETLSMSVELLEKQVQTIVMLSERDEKRLAEVMGAINTFGRIAGLHQDRLDNHGERLDRLDGK